MSYFKFPSFAVDNNLRYYYLVFEHKKSSDVYEYTLEMTEIEAVETIMSQGYFIFQNTGLRFSYYITEISRDEFNLLEDIELI